MYRLLALSLFVLAAATGCHMCASPYDYCGPVVECGCVGGGSCGCGCNSNAAPSEGPSYENGAPMDGGEMVSPQNAPAGSTNTQGISPTPANPPGGYNGSALRRDNPNVALVR
jgi:hypothetical protein